MKTREKVLHNACILNIHAFHKNLVVHKILRAATSNNITKRERSNEKENKHFTRKTVSL
jgi:hypothetical protein